MKLTNPAIIGKQFRLRMSPFCTRRLVGKLCAPSVLIPDCNQDQAENRKKKKNVTTFLPLRHTDKNNKHTVHFLRPGATIMDKRPCETDVTQRQYVFYWKLKKRCYSLKKTRCCAPSRIPSWKPGEIRGISLQHCLWDGGEVRQVMLYSRLG